MQNLLLSTVALALLAVPAVAGAQVDARVWLENEPEYYQRGDRMNVNFVVSDDAYVAVIHVDTDGNLDFVFPETPWDNEFVRGGRIQTLPSRGGAGPWTVRGRAGIGYFYIIASPDPLDFGYFRGRTGSPWDWGYAGRTIHGDPFLAFDQIARMLLPRWPYSPYIYDYYSYYVGGVHRYPAYACSNRYYDYGWGWTPSYGSCSSLNYFLYDHPYYYDTRRYRGDRRLYLREYDRLDPRHGFKEPPDQPARGITSGGSQGFTDDRWDNGLPRRDPVDSRPATGRAAPSGRDVPTSEPQRRPAPEPATRAPAAAPRERPSPSTGRRPAAEPTPSGTDRRPARGRP